MLTDITMTIVAMHMAMTSFGLIFIAVFSSASKYRINPAAEWNPSPFFCCAIFDSSMILPILFLI